MLLSEYELPPCEIALKTTINNKHHRHHHREFSPYTQK